MQKKTKPEKQKEPSKSEVKKETKKEKKNTPVRNTDSDDLLKRTEKLKNDYR